MVAALLVGGCDALFNLDHLPSHDRTPGDGHLDHDAVVDSHVDDPDAQIPAGECAIAFGTSRYFVKGIAADAVYAKEYCKALQVSGSVRYSHLAVISTLSERQYVEPLLAPNDRGWIGLLKGSNAAWGWVTGEVVPAISWAPAQPDNAGGNQGCGVLVQGVGIDDEACSTTAPFVCECDTYPPT